MLDNLKLLTEHSKPEPKCIVRVSTSYWYDGRSAHMKKTVSTLKRKSGFDEVHEECTSAGADMFFEYQLINLDDVEDGLYELVAVNISRDYETGYIDDYDLKLVEYVEEDQANAN